MMAMTTNPVTGEDFTPEEKAMFDGMVYDEMMKIENEMLSIKEQQASIARQKEMVNNRLMELENGDDFDFDFDYKMTLDKYQNISPVKEAPFSNLKQVSILNPFNQDVLNKASAIKQESSVRNNNYSMFKAQNDVDNKIVVPKTNTRCPSIIDEDIINKRQRDLTFFKQLEMDQVNSQSVITYGKEKELARDIQRRDNLPIGAPVLVNVAPRNLSYSVAEVDFEPNPLMLGTDPFNARIEKKQKQLLYLEQLNMQRVEKENSALNMNLRQPYQDKKEIAEYECVPSNVCSTDDSKQSGYDEKKRRQKKYFEDLSAAAESKPIQSERVSLVKNRHDGIQDVKRDALYMNSLPIGKASDDRSTKKEKQMRYFKELSDATKLPVISNLKPAHSNPRFEIAKARKSLIESIDHKSYNYYQEAYNDEYRIKKKAQQEYARQLNEGVETKNTMSQNRNEYNAYLDERPSILVSGFGKAENHLEKAERQKLYARQLNEDRQQEQRHQASASSNNHQPPVEYRNNWVRGNTYDSEIPKKLDQKVKAEEELEYRQLVMEAALKEFQRKKNVQYLHNPIVLERNEKGSTLENYEEQPRGLRRFGRPQDYVNQLQGQI